MVKKAELIVENFDNGITVCWKDTDGVIDSTKEIALDGHEAECIGKQIWSDIFEYIEKKGAEKVLVKLEYDYTF